MPSVPDGVARCLAIIGVALAVGACSASAPAAATPDPVVPGATATPVASPVGQPAGTEAASSAPAPPAQAPVGEAGSFTVDGTEFAVTLLNRCIPFSDAPGNVDLQALATGAQLNLALLGEELDVSVQGPAIEEAFGSIAFGEDAVVGASAVAGDRWTGSATVGDSLGSGSTVDLAWDVQVPADAVDCGL